MRVGEKGVQLQVETSFDLTGCDSLKLVLKPPGATSVVVEKIITPIPSSGTTFTYTTTDTDFPTPGAWELQAKAEFGAGAKKLKSKIVRHDVERALN